jgi:1,4-alpha-glucan branching enzyme
MFRWRAAIVAVVLASCAARREGVHVSRSLVELRVRRPSARSMAIAGDFNGWSLSSHPMTRDGDYWTARLVLPPGEYLFMYVADGRAWITPAPPVEQMPDGFGGANGRVVVP